MLSDVGQVCLSLAIKSWLMQQKIKIKKRKKEKEKRGQVLGMEVSSGGVIKKRMKRRGVVGRGSTAEASHCRPLRGSRRLPSRPHRSFTASQTEAEVDGVWGEAKLTMRWARQRSLLTSLAPELFKFVPLCTHGVSWQWVSRWRGRRSQLCVIFCHFRELAANFDFSFSCEWWIDKRRWVKVWVRGSVDQGQSLRLSKVKGTLSGCRKPFSTTKNKLPLLAVKTLDELVEPSKSSGIN